METNYSDQSTNEPNAKRPKMETDGCTSSKPEAKEPFLSLPSDILARIIVEIPIAQWPSLELLDEHFRGATLIAWRQLRNVNVDRDFFQRKSPGETKSILGKLVEGSPFLTSLSGIGFQSENAALNSDVVQLLAEFEHLQSISFGTIERGTPLESLVEFLECTRSRSSLKEVRMYNVDRGQAPIIDRFASSFATGHGTESALNLEKFLFTSPDRSLRIRLDTLDTSRLTELRVGKASIEPEQLTHLIERASNLQRIELSFIRCSGLTCTSPRLQANKKLLTAIASRENLSALKFEHFVAYNNDICMDFAPEFVEMLKTIGRRGKLRKLGLEYFLVFPSAIRIMDIFETIRNFIPYLQSINISNISLCERAVCDIASLMELEEINFTKSSTDITANGCKKIAQLPQLKRLAFHASMGKNSLMYLADAPALTDLRIGCADVISADVFQKWSHGFAANLEILMLGKVAFTPKNRDAENGLVRLLEKAVELRVLILEGNITYRSLVAIANSCPKLEILGVRSTSNEIVGHYLQIIVDRCPYLVRMGGFDDEMRKKLQLANYRKIRDLDMGIWNYDFGDSEYD